jgi:membrane dipeptidase
MRQAVVWDNHACMPLRPHDTGYLPQLERFRQSGVDAVTLNVGFGENSIEDHVRTLASMRRWLQAHDGDFVMAGSVADIEEAKAQGKLAVLFDIEGMGAVGDQPSLVRLYYDLGVRWMLVAYNNANLAGGGCQGDDIGLTALGRRIVDEMNACGMIACGSHTGYRTARELIDHSADPVIFSHSNPRALWDHHRNIPDDLMVACADRGGVVGINGIGLFLGERTDLAAAVVRHIDYAVSLVGPEHVGLGLDYVFDAEELDHAIATMPDVFPASFGFQPGMPFPMLGPEGVPTVVQGLADLGYGADAITAVLGGNLMRVARAVWRPQAPLLPLLTEGQP